MKKNNKSTFTITLTVIIVFFVIYYLGLLSRTEQSLFHFFSPLQKQLYNWSVAFNKFNQLGDILAENDYLKEEFSKLSVDYVKLRSLEAENDYLRKELNYLETNRFVYVLADVVGKQLYNQQILLINKGSRQGLVKDSAVTAGEGVIVGKVVAVTDQKSEVQLLTDPNSQLAVSFTEAGATSGIVKGSAGNSLIMEYIPQDLVIKAGDWVITSGLEEKIPRGLLVGTVTEAENLVGQIFQKANILPPFNYLNLQTLTIIVPRPDI